MNHDPSFLFELRVATRAKAPRIIIRAFDRPYQHSPTGHSYIDVEVRHSGKVIFPRGQLWCGVNAWTSTDGIEAKELVMSCVAVKPGDTDEDYFAAYTADQLAWAEAHGEALDWERQARYCDPETGDVRS